ncbi:MAG: molybdopterin molybdotransferase MoeA, partial [Clostridia bacterium]|nr:molybdopterin molybdotransferase MoeA [Clostridia bacterium]
MLKVVTLEQAKDIICSRFPGEIISCETVDISQIPGRIAAEDIVSAEDVPAFSRSVMDGYAVKACDTYGASASMPSMLDIDGEILMGQTAEKKLEGGHCFRISTGGMLPGGADAVIPVEYTDEETGNMCLLYKSVSPLENVTSRGDDVKIGQCVIPRGKLLSFKDVGVLAAMGAEHIKVIRRPVAGIISTGDELTEISEKPRIGQIRDVNSHLLSAVCEKYGCEAKRYGIIRDDRSTLTQTIKKAVDECDFILISGGSSAGEKDMTASVISELGEVYIHGIAMKPGKPTIIGKINGKGIFGLPGHPAAAFFVAETAVKPFIDRITGARTVKSFYECELSENISSNHGREESTCVRTENGVASPPSGKPRITSPLPG